ncbi:MAG: phosphoribosylanthranilate isomerase, partial [Candidatus Altiarchaeales archaeon]|nr:phosphoribosylanthranilate isomerase [Candidatus Altiarchaeales archaeon]
DYLGFIVDVPVPTPRRIGIAEAKNITQKINTPHVCVMMPENLAQVGEVVDELSPNLIQLHGAESPSFIDDVKENHGVEVIKTVHVTEGLDMHYVFELAASADYLLLDTKTDSQVGGCGRTHDWGVSAEISRIVDVPVILAGGLNYSNVESAISKVNPYMVDVASGVESGAGRKDPGKIRKFIEKAKR